MGFFEDLKINRQVKSAMKDYVKSKAYSPEMLSGIQQCYESYFRGNLKLDEFNYCVHQPNTQLMYVARYNLENGVSIEETGKVIRNLQDQMLKEGAAIETQNIIQENCIRLKENIQNYEKEFNKVQLGSFVEINDVRYKITKNMEEYLSPFGQIIANAINEKESFRLKYFGQIFTTDKSVSINEDINTEKLRVQNLQKRYPGISNEKVLESLKQEDMESYLRHYEQMYNEYTQMKQELCSEEMNLTIHNLVKLNPPEKGVNKKEPEIDKTL